MIQALNLCITFFGMVLLASATLWYIAYYCRYLGYAFGTAIWLMIIVPPWSSVIHPMLGQVSVVSQQSPTMFGIRFFGLLVGMYFFHVEAKRYIGGDPISRRSVYFQWFGMASAFPPFLLTYF